MLSLIAPALLASVARAQVIATGANGATNPDAPAFYPIGAQVNQTSYSRLITINSVDDFCVYAPPEPGPDSLIGNTEAIEVAWCTKPRNGARLIPDGVIKSAHFIKTAAYAQVYGTWDGTKINIVAGDTGGELDPHGAENLGNPIGGNVTSNWGGSDVFYEEWMSFVSSTTFCFRVCTAVVNGVTTAEECEHKLDLLGCGWVMAIPNDAADPGFTSCDGDVAVAPGRYPLPDGSTSTFAQRFTYTANGTPVTIGQTATPAAPALYPSTSNCVTYSTIANGVDPANLMVTAAPTLLQSGSSVVVTGVGSTTMATTTAVVSPVVASSGNNTNAVAGAADATGAAGASSGAGSGSGSSSSGGASASSTGAKSGALGTTSVNTGLVGVVVGAILVGAAAVF